MLFYNLGNTQTHMKSDADYSVYRAALHMSREEIVRQ